METGAGTNGTVRLGRTTEPDKVRWQVGVVAIVELNFAYKVHGNCIQQWQVTHSSCIPTVEKVMVVMGRSFPTKLWYLSGRITNRVAGNESRKPVYGGRYRNLTK